MKNSEKGTLLRSWKEISVHLGVDERTCARWEKRLGMPVHRALRGSARSQVFAYTDELDGWFHKTFPSSNTSLRIEAINEDKTIPRKFFTRTIYVAIVLIAAISIVYFASIWRRSFGMIGNQPADFHLRGSELAIVDKNGKTLWQKILPHEGLYPEEKYRDYFQVSKKSGASDNLPWVAIRDINGDKKNEVLFAVKKVSNTYGERELICFDCDGKINWQFNAGREMIYRGKSYSADYRIHGFVLHDINKDGRLEIIVSSFHYPWEMCQLAILDCQGNQIGEFWNAGYLTDVLFTDADMNGNDEMYVVGVNNEYGGGCLAVFDPTNVKGASPQGEGFKFNNVSEGSELYYIDFPLTEVSKAGRDLVNGNTRVSAMSNKRIQVMTILGLFYEFDAQLRCLAVEPGHKFIKEYKALRAEGRIHIPLEDAYYERLREALRYWTGSSWSSVPSRNINYAVHKKMP